MLDSFYRRVLGADQGRFALFFGGNKEHQWFDTIDQLVEATESYDGSNGSIYFATSCFADGSENRVQANAVSRANVCLDIDAGPEKYAKHGDKVYPTQKDALAALVAWSTDTGLIPTFIVSSGQGLHVYFCHESLSIDEWAPLAHAVRNAATAKGLRIDAQVTTDSARVLRPPGSIHPCGAKVSVIKDTRLTHSLEGLTAKLVGYEPPKPRQSLLNQEILLAAPVGPPKTLAKIVDRCPAMAHAVGAKGDIPEPYWRAMLGIIKFTVEGEEAAHACSEGHPDYDYGATQAKLDRWTAGPTTCSMFEGENPSACAGCSFRGRVKSPIMLGQMTPMELGVVPDPVADALREIEGEEPAAEAAHVPFASDDEPVAPQSPWAGHLPPSYMVLDARTGHIMVRETTVKVEDAAGDMVERTVQIPFAAVPFWFESWAPGVNDNDQALATFCVYDSARKSITRYTMPTKVMARRDTLFGHLAQQNVQVFPPTNEAKNAMEAYVSAAMERIRVAGQRQKIANRFGTMYDSSGNMLVAQGQHIILHDGRIIEGVVQDRMRQRGSAYRAPVPQDGAGAWSDSVWDEHILPRAKRHIAYLQEFYSDDNFRPYQLAIMLAWASPLLAFMQGTYRPGTELPGAGLTVSLYSQRSGIGKTAAMHAAALAFGNPAGICLQLDRNNSTANARQGLLLQSGTMPIFMDEMEDLDPRDLANLVSSVGNGASKSRMTKDLALTGGETMALVNIMSTNKSHRELVAADRSESPAVQMRMLEIDCGNVREAPREVAEREAVVRASIQDCAGAIGAIIHRVMCEQGADQINQLGLECAEQARRMLDGRQDGRFLWRAWGAVLAVRRILNSQGLLVFKKDDLLEEFKHWHDEGYDFVKTGIMPSDPAELMSLCLSDLAAHTLITRTETHRNPAAPEKYDVVVNDRIPDNVLARAVLANRWVYLKTSALRDWCISRRISERTLTKLCLRDRIFMEPPAAVQQRRAGKVDLYKGTKYAQGIRVPVYKVLLDRLHVDYGSDDNLTENEENVVRLFTPDVEQQEAHDEQANG